MIAYNIARNWARYALLLLPCKFAALFYVPFMLKWGDRIYNPVFGNRNGGDPNNKIGDYVWFAIRNSCHNFLTKPKPVYRTYPVDIKDATLEKRTGFQWRFRVSEDDPAFASFRMTWGKPNASKGKKEFYIGWTMREFDGSKPETTMSFTFFQLRMTWEWFVPAVAVIWWLL